ncbi:hypothetical protein HPB48_017933 [Haemaphysalis longicornis]|uniref:Cytochrome P450 n=1 Tax=Haemaphysalis longicornis TaxID=44386 RepID=A0A9J6G971_HAELO|nr:hypothetical protein HPB48_017933 [Haemaphysalis longicornis]
MGGLRDRVASEARRSHPLEKKVAVEAPPVVRGTRTRRAPRRGRTEAAGAGRALSVAGILLRHAVSGGVFLPENVALQHGMAYQPFGQGPRNCVGKRLALVEIIYTVGRIVERFRLQPGPSQKASIWAQSSAKMHKRL